MRLTPGGFDCLRCFPLSPRHTFARIPGLEPLAEKSVVIFGVGALGSRIAVGLAASGLRKAHLLDHDAYEPVNGVRHAAGFTFFGLPKVLVVRELMVQANPFCLPYVTMQTGRAGSLSAREDEILQERIRSADLIINATASEHVAHWLGRVCHRLGRPHVHATVTNGAWGGDVIRVIPGLDACWVCQQVAHDPPPTQPRPPGGFFAPGCAHPTFTGNMAEVGIVADLAMAMAIETMLQVPSRNFQGSHIRWSARSTTGVWAPTIEVVAPNVRTECPLCSPNPNPSATHSSPTTPSV
ncbi:MAG: ThiF family adenylyltransferase [Verrucomicrobiota bacterium]